MERKSKTVILGIIENEKGEILMTERLDPKIKDAHKKRDVPGGKNEFGENFEQTILREIYEETGLVVTSLEAMPDTYAKVREHEEYIQDTILHCYICKVDSGTIQTNDPKIGQVQRMDIDQALDLDVLETTQFFLEKYRDKKKK